jgi:hypothetical protein
MLFFNTFNVYQAAIQGGGHGVGHRRVGEVRLFVLEESVLFFCVSPNLQDEGPGDIEAPNVFFCCLRVRITVFYASSGRGCAYGDCG